MKLHNNGRLLDTYHRLNGSNDDFLVPYDQEVSAKELTYICRKAEAWRGVEGERRKTIVSNFTWKEQDDPVWEAIRKAQTEGKIFQYLVGNMISKGLVSINQKSYRSCGNLYRSPRWST